MDINVAVEEHEEVVIRAILGANDFAHRMNKVAVVGVAPNVLLHRGDGPESRHSHGWWEARVAVAGWCTRRNGWQSAHQAKSLQVW